MLAYIDPGSGSYLFQILIASALGGLFFFRQQFARMLAFLKNLFSSRGKGGTGSD